MRSSKLFRYLQTRAFPISTWPILVHTSTVQQPSVPRENAHGQSSSGRQEPFQPIQFTRQSTENPFHHLPTSSGVTFDGALQKGRNAAAAAAIDDDNDDDGVTHHTHSSTAA